MTHAEFYQSIHDNIANHPGFCRLLRQAVAILPGIVYAVYPLMLLYLLIWNPDALLRAVLVPAAGFFTVTILRAAINAPRPYEVMEIPPLTPKDTHGKSFPSRHAACAAVIAVGALKVLPPLGLFLCLLALLIGLSRVLAGVHFIRDVAAGLILGGLIGIIGMYLI